VVLGAAALAVALVRATIGSAVYVTRALRRRTSAGSAGVSM
jgi:hypothetical protein